MLFVFLSLQNGQTLPAPRISVGSANTTPPGWRWLLVNIKKGLEKWTTNNRRVSITPQKNTIIGLRELLSRRHHSRMVHATILSPLNGRVVLCAMKCYLLDFEGHTSGFSHGQLLCFGRLHFVSSISCLYHRKQHVIQATSSFVAFKIFMNNHQPQQKC